MTRRSRKLLLLSSLALVAGALVLVCGIDDAARNSLTLLRLERSFRRIQHPPQTEPVRFVSRVGLLSGNGNHCDYFVGELRVARAGAPVLPEAYAGAMVVDPFDGSRQPVLVDYVDGEGLDLEGVPDAMEQASAWLQGAPRPPGRLYLVRYFANLPPNRDIRCH